MEYIFPIAEIEYHIIGYLDPIIDFIQLSLVSKYYHDVIINDKVYVALKKFCLDKPIIFKNTYVLTKEGKNFILACQYNHLLVAKYLQSKYSLNTYSDNKYAFKYACRNGHLEVVKWLYYSGIELNSPYPPKIGDIRVNNEYEFKYACRNGHLEVAEWLYHLGKKIIFRLIFILIMNRYLK